MKKFISGFWKVCQTKIADLFSVGEVSAKSSKSKIWPNFKMPSLPSLPTLNHKSTPPWSFHVSSGPKPKRPSKLFTENWTYKQETTTIYKRPISNDELAQLKAAEDKKVIASEVEKHLDSKRPVSRRKI